MSKDTINGMKRQHTGWHKMIANNLSEKRLISRK
jgi:hypothetical protein